MPAAAVLGYAKHASLPAHPFGAPPCLSYVHFGTQRLPFVPNVTHKPGELGSSGPSQKWTAALLVVGVHDGRTQTAVGKKSSPLKTVFEQRARFGPFCVAQSALVVHAFPTFNEAYDEPVRALAAQCR